MNRSRWRHSGEYALGRSLQGLISVLPERGAAGMGETLGGLVRWPLGIRRSVVEANLRRAFPAAGDEWIERTAKATFRHLGREAVAILRLARATPAEIRERTEMHGMDVLREALGEGRGALLFTGHLGNWEIGAASIAARGLPMAAVVKRLRNRLIDARIDGIRQALGVETLDQREAPRQLPRMLRRGYVIGIVADQDARRAGVWVPFFGHPASTHRGPALFALRLGAPIFASFVRRLPGRVARYRIELERVSLPQTGELDADVRTLTATLTTHLETAIRAAPEQYFWFHKRWKTPPPTP